MGHYSQHPEVPIPHEFAETVDRVASGIERVIVLTAEGEPRAALVSLSTLRELDRVDALDNGDEREEEDRVGLSMRPSDAESASSELERSDRGSS